MESRKWGQRDEPSWAPVITVGVVILALLVGACWMSGLLDWLLDIKAVVVTVG